MRLSTRVAGAYGMAGRVVDIFLKMVENRLELFALEVREEKIHFIQLFVMATITIFLLILGFVTLTATLIFLLPSGSRLAGLIALSAIYLIAALVMVLVLWKRISDHPVPFTHSISELMRDRDEL